MHQFSRARVTAVVLALGVALGTLAVAHSAAASVSTETSTESTAREVHLRFDADAPDEAFTTNDGNASVDVEIERAAGGSEDSVMDRHGAIGALRLPEYSSGFAAVRLLGATYAGDALNPGTSDFTFGAHVKLDSVNEGATYDNGNNLIQRGLYKDVSQWKIQVDGGRPSCRVKGAAGAVSLSAPSTIQPGRWYAISCTRSAGAVTIEVVDLATGVSSERRREGVTGNMTPSSPSVPMSVGAKLRNDGTIITGSSDQFNGVIDNAFLDILR